jgi:hypothetical protein
MQLWNFEGSYVVFACFTPVDSAILRLPFSLRRTRADNQPGLMKGCLAQLVRDLRRHESKPRAGGGSEPGNNFS